ncbi:hypothetical protein [Cryptosporangium aurantiacum]|uniref:Uncharacterized protein n=1 Tax=Cryptosporangium aurantiacum TaxID=134849 RepID=A0A1M7PQC9_9ACTN|nr:hypothetical protein [Cryptosporangium aurantiacum]SHN19406.1 hypothetical protein SAMN05443668_103571 [Cryptosporangium aurantiacum]
MNADRADLDQSDLLSAIQTQIDALRIVLEAQQHLLNAIKCANPGAPPSAIVRPSPRRMGKKR